MGPVERIYRASQLLQMLVALDTIAPGTAIALYPIRLMTPDGAVSATAQVPNQVVPALQSVFKTGLHPVDVFVLA